MYVILFRKRVFAVVMKLRISRLEDPRRPMTNVFRGRGGDRHRGKGDVKMEDWRDVSISQGRSRLLAATRSQERGTGLFSSQRPQTCIHLDF